MNKALTRIMTLLAPLLVEKKVEQVGNYSKARPVSFKKKKDKRYNPGTNHARVVAGRASRMGITVEEYMEKFPRQ